MRKPAMSARKATVVRTTRTRNEAFRIAAPRAVGVSRDRS
jgi:hypothetical protein